MSQAFDEVLAAALERPIERDEALLLFRETQGDAAKSEQLFAAARQVRRQETGDVFRLTGGVGSVLRCTLKPLCQYCPYWRDRGGEPLPTEAIVAAALEFQRAGMRSFHLSGGTTLGDDGSEMLAIVQAIYDAGVRNMPIYVNCGAAMSVDTMRALKKLGVARVGAVFEITNPDVFARVKPGDDLERKMQFAEDIGAAGLQLGSGMMAGLGPAETRYEDYVNTIFDIARFSHLSSMYVSKFRPDPCIPMKDWPQCPTEEGMRVVAIARLVLRGVEVGTAAGWLDSERALGLHAGGGNSLFAFAANRRVGYWKRELGIPTSVRDMLEFRDTREEKRRFARECGVTIDENA